MNKKTRKVKIDNIPKEKKPLNPAFTIRDSIILQALKFYDTYFSGGNGMIANSYLTRLE